MALTKTVQAIVASASNTAGSTTRGRLLMTGVQGGGFLTIKIENGSPAPATQCVCNILVAHNTSLPAAASAGSGSAWVTIASYGGGITANARTEMGMSIDPAIMCLEVEFTGNTTQPVQVEAILSELTTVA